MNTITITDLIPLTEENNEVLIMLYKMTRDYSYKIYSERTIEFIKKKYPNSWNVYCKNIYLLDGKSKELYQSLILAGELTTQNGVEIYLNSYLNKSNHWLATSLITVLYPFHLLIVMMGNKVWNSDLTLKQSSLLTALGELTTVYLRAGYDVEFDFKTSKKHKIVNPYELLKTEFNDEEIKVLKAIGKISYRDLIINETKVADKIFLNLDSNKYGKKEATQVCKKFLKYNFFRSCIDQMLNEI